VGGEGDQKFAEAVLRDGIDVVLNGDLDTGKPSMRDYRWPLHELADYIVL
jgi:hypothetical protein